MSRSRARKLPRDPVQTTIESLSHDGRGVTHIDGKAVFIDGALPGEEITFIYTSKRRKFDEGSVEEVITPSDDRVTAKCPHFDICGGCSLQHMSPSAQIDAKQQVLLENLARIGEVQAGEVLEPLTGPHWGYRHKARLGAKYVRKKGRVLVGFRERRKPYVADLSRCEVLHPSVGTKFDALIELIDGLSIRDRVPQIEVAVASDTTALVFRHLDPFTEEDTIRLIAFGKESGMHVYLQPGGEDSVAALWPEDSRLECRLAEQDITLEFRPTDFMQINPAINQAMIARVIEFLAPNENDNVLDLFCGLGNFSLPLARKAGSVVGVEGDAGLIERAKRNAQRNNIDNASFHCADLSKGLEDADWAKKTYDKILIDPPRCGALELMPQIPCWKANKIVYVSCHPGSLARDAGILVNEHGYHLVSAGVMDMFPHTAHVESIAVFEKGR